MLRVIYVKPSTLSLFYIKLMICASLIQAMNMDASLELVKLLRKTIKLVLYKAVVNYSNQWRSEPAVVNKVCLGVIVNFTLSCSIQRVVHLGRSV